MSDYYKDKKLNPNYYEVFPKLLELAEEAYSHNTYAIGAALLDETTGEILRYARNQVIKDDKIFNYQHHAEKQLIDWLIANEKELGIKGHTMTIISSLDPCIMCAGTALASNVNIISVALDERAGANHWGNCSYPFFNDALKSEAQKSLGYFAIEGTDRDKHLGYKGDEFDKVKISKALHDGVLNYFIESTKIVDEMKANDNIGEDPCTVDQVNFYRSIQDIGYSINSNDDKINFVNHVMELAYEGATSDTLNNVAAIIDGNKDVLLFGVQNPSHPIKTAISNVMHKYWEMKVALEKGNNCYIETLENVSMINLFDLSHSDAVSFMDLAIARPIAKHVRGENYLPSFTYFVNKDNADPFFHLLNTLPSRYKNLANEGAQQAFPDQDLSCYVNSIVNQFNVQQNVTKEMLSEFFNNAILKCNLIENHYLTNTYHDEL
jgi:tRNA(Arg) A34 adenosine deaminase TadA